MLALTQTAVVTCDHVVGIVGIVASQQFVTIDGKAVLVSPDPVGKPIVGCPNIGPTIKPCLTTLAVKKGYSDFVSVDGRKVCLEPVTGLTDGTPPGVVNYKVRAPGQQFVNVST